MREITIISGKGGTGKSSLAAAFATADERVVVADCDVDAANMYLVLNPINFHEEVFIAGQTAVVNHQLCTQCGLCIDLCRFDAIAMEGGKVEISHLACDGCKLCFRECPQSAISMIDNDKSRWYAGMFRNGFMVHARLAPGDDNSGKLVSVVREHARYLADSNGLDTIVIDGPPGAGCPVIASLSGTQLALAVTEPTLTGLHDLERLVELTKGFRLKTLVIINKYDLNTEMAARITKWCDSQGIPIVGQLPFDPIVVEAMMQCKSVVEWAPSSSFSDSIKEIWKRTLSYLESCQA